MKKTALVIALGVALTACSKKEEATTEAPAAPKAAPAANLPLSYAPAGTAYVMGNFEPAPKTYIDTVTPMVNSIKAAVLQTIDRSLEALAQEDEPQAQTALQWVKERLQQPETLESMGIRFNSMAAVYEIAALPVMRLELADTQRFQAFIAEIEGKLGEKIPTAEVNGQPYWHIALDRPEQAQDEQPQEATQAAQPATAKPTQAPTGPQLVWAVVGQHLVMSIVPSSDLAQMPRLLGLEKPARSVIDSGELAAVNKEFGYQPYGPSLLLDTRRMLALAMPEQNNWISRQLKEDGIVIDATCKAELESIAAKAPRLMGGAKEMSQQKAVFSGLLELESKIAGDLQKIAAPVPALGSSRQGVEFGFSLNIQPLAQFLQAQSQAVQAAPYQCALLAPLNEGMAQMNQSIAGLYAVAGFASGVRVHLQELDLDTQKVRGMLLVASPNPQGLLGMAQGMMPELGKLGLLPDGQAKPLQSPLLGTISQEQDKAWLAMTDKSLGIAVGSDGQRPLEDALKATGLTPAPLVYFGADGPSYAKLQKEFNDLSRSMMPPEADDLGLHQFEQLMEPLNQAAIGLYQSLRFVSSNYHFSSRGLELTSETQFR